MTSTGHAAELRPTTPAELRPTSAAKPAPPRLRRSPVPKHEPRAASRVSLWDDGRRVPATQGTLALALPDAFTPDPTAHAPDDPSTPGGTVDSSIGLLPEPNAWAAGFIQAAMEVAAGQRSA